jgi:hypothetical protein
MIPADAEDTAAIKARVEAVTTARFVCFIRSLSGRLSYIIISELSAVTLWLRLRQLTASIYRLATFMPERNFYL